MSKHFQPQIKQTLAFATERWDCPMPLTLCVINQGFFFQAEVSTGICSTRKYIFEVSLQALSWQCHDEVCILNLSNIVILDLRVFSPTLFYSILPAQKF